MAYPILESKTEGVQNNTTSTSISLPSGVSSGDLLILLVSINSRITSTIIDQGWSNFSEERGTSSCQDVVFIKTATSSEVAPTITLSDGSYYCWSCYRISGASIADLVTDSTAQSSNVSSFEYPSVEIADDTLVLRFATIDASGGGVLTYPSGAIQSEQTASGAVFHLVVGDNALPTSTGTDSLILDDVDRGITRTIAIQFSDAAPAISTIDSDNNVAQGQDNVTLTLDGMDDATALTALSIAGTDITTYDTYVAAANSVTGIEIPASAGYTSDANPDTTTAQVSATFTVDGSPVTITLDNVTTRAPDVDSFNSGNTVLIGGSDVPFTLSDPNIITGINSLTIDPDGINISATNIRYTAGETTGLCNIPSGFAEATYDIAISIAVEA